MNQPQVVLCWENDGIFEKLGESYSLAAFGGVLPEVGDIISSGVLVGLDRELTENWEVFEVLYRYFTPADQTSSPLIYLVVQARRAQEREINIIGD